MRPLQYDYGITGNNIKHRRLPELDALRGLAALAVMVHHNLLAADLVGSRIGQFLSHSPLHALADGRQAVMFFFVLSGFVLTGAVGHMDGLINGSRWCRWILQRSVRLGVPVLASIIASLLLYVHLGGQSWAGESGWLRSFVWQDAPTMSNVIGQALLLHSAYHYPLNNVLWSLAHEWRVSLLFPLIVLLPSWQGRQGGTILLLVGIALGAAAGGNFGEHLNLNPGLIGQALSTIYFVMPFAIGAALYRLEIWNVKPSKLQEFHSFLALAFLSTVGTDYADYIASAILIWLAIQPSKLRSLLRSRWFKFFGDIAFSLYLVHVIVIAVIYHAFHGELPIGALFFISCGLSIGSAFLFGLSVEKPAHRWARAIGNGGAQERTGNKPSVIASAAEL